VSIIEPIRPAWTDRDIPIRAAAVVVHGAAARELALSAMSRLSAGASLSAAVGHGFLVIIGDEADLPWCDGAVYLGWEAAVLVPTTRVPNPRTPLIADTARRGAGTHDLVVVLPQIVLHTPNPRPIADPAQLINLVADR